MFDNFINHFNCHDAHGLNSNEDFLSYVGGKTFYNNLFTLFSDEDRTKWSLMVEKYFPMYKGTVSAFGHDWQGNVFSIDTRDNNVKIFDPVNRESYSTNMSLADFLNDAINDANSAFVGLYFEDYVNHGGAREIPYGRCVGYKVPLFLGGKDEVDNLEESDMDVYWTMTLDMQNTIH